MFEWLVGLVKKVRFKSSKSLQLVQLIYSISLTVSSLTFILIPSSSESIYLIEFSTIIIATGRPFAKLKVFNTLIIKKNTVIIIPNTSFNI